VAANAGHLAVCYGHGRIEWLSTDAEMRTLHGATVPGARDIALTPSADVLALASNSLWEVGRTNGALTERIRDLRVPRRTAVDSASGDILVVEDGGSGQIRRYAKDFRFLRAYGRPGGRRQGLYAPEDYCAVSDICADNRGGFLVVENWSAPRRMAHFDADGRALREWYGGQLFFTLAAADPADARRVWMNSHWGWIMETEVDYEARTWKPRATYAVNNIGEGLFQRRFLAGRERRRRATE
jgi:hypothetical protein